MASVLIIDDDPDVTRALTTFFQRAEHQVASASTGDDGVECARTLRPDLILLDLRLPDMDGFDVLSSLRELDAAIVIITGHGDVQLAVEAMRRGAENFLTKPVDLDVLGVAAARAIEHSRLRQMNRYLSGRHGAGPDGALLGISPALRDLTHQVELLAAAERTTVLLLGESGTGKGRVAEAIHALSPRAARPFVEVNCAGLTATFLDSELFGHERGAFTDAKDRKLGLFEVADGGTLFLDEIGDLDPQLQPKLLKVLEGKSFRRMGGTQEISVNVRLIAATNRDLVGEVREGRFREDLYYRLSVMPLHLPPLRARAREDLLDLIARCLHELHGQLPDSASQLTEPALQVLLAYPWPGNVRELRNVLERAMIVGRGAQQIGVEHLPAELTRPAVGVRGPTPTSLAAVERAHIERTLRANNDNRTRTAKALGISRATLINKIKQYSLDGSAASGAAPRRRHPAGVPPDAEEE
ncbi:MAG TPA: sigma-54 dependent transcriptional regulator [Gemmatimonadaceae bacterium]|nr:sigma-54 dependent transcriptional regulator [Gemmatimonadaceae bacterium]